MRYAIFSDVHGNLEALTAALTFFEGRSIDRYVFMGDAVGYGASPNEVCDLIRPLVSHAVLGNHDAAVAGRMPFDEYYDAARHSLNWCVEQMTPENMEWLRQIPYTDQDETFAYCHGSPGDPEGFDYLFSPDQVVDMLRLGLDLPRVTLIGHSHLTVAFRVTGNTVESLVKPELTIDDDSHYIVTVGSVGQPRDRDPRACCCTYDTEERVLRFHRLHYDVLTARQRIHDAGLSPVFGDRLLVGM
ncbi:MAG: metallophosphoesterase family protein [Myxococcota bacterium]